MLKRVLVILLLVLVGCSAESIPPTPVVAPTVAPPRPTDTLVPTNPPPTNPPTPTDLPTAVPTDPPTVPPPSPTPVVLAQDDLALGPDDVFIYPVPQVVAGDLVTFQVQAVVPPTIDPQAVAVTIVVDDRRVVTSNLGWRNLADDAIGLYEWVWEATVPGTYSVRVALDPNDTIQDGDADPSNNVVELQLTVLAADGVAAEWISAETNHAVIYAVSGTAAARDLAQLEVLVDAAVEEAARSLQIEPPGKPITVYFVERIFGQGGYAGASIVVTYSDRNYSGGGMYEVLVHEAVHILDQAFEPNGAFRFMVEGLAVWATGGHYKQENLNRRAAALLETDLYMPLEPLINDFYPAQHEVGYLQAGALMAYLVSNYGWDRVRDFYSSLEREPGRTPADTISNRMQRFFGKTLAQMESDWLFFLRNQPYDRADVVDLQTTVRYYNVMRRYQQAYDPTAYYLQAWLPYPNGLRDRQTTAEVTRRAADETRVALETMLESADIAMRNTDYDSANVLLDSVERVLSVGTFLDPVAANYLAITRATAELGYEAQKIQLQGDTAAVFATIPGSPELTRLTMQLDQQGWTLAR